MLLSYTYVLFREYCDCYIILWIMFCLTGRLSCIRGVIVLIIPRRVFICVFFIHIWCHWLLVGSIISLIYMTNIVLIDRKAYKNVANSKHIIFSWMCYYSFRIDISIYLEDTLMTLYECLHWCVSEWYNTVLLWHMGLT